VFILALVLPGKAIDENAKTYAGHQLLNPKSKIQNPKSRLGIAGQLSQETVTMGKLAI
jgi:hypothetical protein